MLIGENVEVSVQAFQKKPARKGPVRQESFIKGSRTKA